MCGFYIANIGADVRVNGLANAWGKVWGGFWFWLSLWDCRVALLAVVGGLASCTIVGPDFSEPEAVELPASWNQESSEESRQRTANWWKVFNDSTLDELVERASMQNLDIEAAGLRIVQARAALGIADALRYPQQQTVSGSLARIYREDDDFKSGDLGFDVGWEMDVWGKYARGIESAEAALYATIASYDDVLISVTAEVARNYVNYRTFQERILLSEQNIKIQQRVLEMTEVQFESGNVSELDVQQAKTQLYGTQSVLPGLKILMAQSRNALAILLGILPVESEAILTKNKASFKIEDYTVRLNKKGKGGAGSIMQKAEGYIDYYDSHSIIPVAPDVEISIDADLVRRRPDIQVAELLARAQSAQIGLAESALYPSFSLFGSIGISDTVRTGESLSSRDAISVVAGPAFTWDVFQYGRLKNQVRVQDALFQESLTNYNKQVLQAVQEVSNALVGYEYSRQQRLYNFSAVEASIRSFNISMIQYNNGLVTYQRLLSTVENMTRNEDVYAQIKGSIANQVVALYKALGGGWQMRTGKPLLSDEVIQQMKERTDWGDYLDKGGAPPAGGK